MHNYLYEESLKRAKYKVWIFSDLQQSKPEKAKECLDVSMADFRLLGNPCDMIWCLGDMIEGTVKKDIDKMCASLEETLVKIGVPVCFSPGNHEFDYTRYGENSGTEAVIPFNDVVKKHKNWYGPSDVDAPYFKVPFGDFMIYFFCDHIAKDKSWCTTHGDIHGNAESYPYVELLKNIKEEMKKDDCPIITASHYAFGGGSRSSELLNSILPVPDNVKLHFFGHAHIGDFVWAGENPYQRISFINGHDIPQMNVSSFEHIRGFKCRSVFLHIYEDNSLGIFFRNHDDHVFTECYFPSKERFPHANYAD